MKKLQLTGSLKDRGKTLAQLTREKMRMAWGALRSHPYRRIIVALIILNGVSVLLFLLRLAGAENFRYWFMLWNLLLAWVAPLFAWWLAKRLRTTKWRSPPNVLLTIIWLGFLPNSYYMVSDLVHVHLTGEVSVYFDTALFASFIFNGFIAGYLGVYWLHTQLLRRVSLLKSFAILGGVFLLSGYAIYLGRVLRWNTWDALFQPDAVLFDVSDNILHPMDHPQAFVVTFSFALLISALYLVYFEVIRLIKPTKR